MTQYIGKREQRLGQQWLNIGKREVRKTSNMADLATVSKGELAERYQRAKGAIMRAREQTREVTKKGTALVMTAAGGFAAGVIDDRVPEVGGLPTGVVVGVGLGLLGVVGAAGDASEHLLSFGSGVLAGAAYGQGKKFSQGLDLK